MQTVVNRAIELMSWPLQDYYEYYNSLDPANMIFTALIPTTMEELKEIMNAVEFDKFDQLCTGFFKKFEDNCRTSSFMSYFQQHYMPRCTKWAMCHRNFPHASVNTTGHIESFHNRLKRKEKRKSDQAFREEGLEHGASGSGQNGLETSQTTHQSIQEEPIEPHVLHVQVDVHDVASPASGHHVRETSQTRDQPVLGEPTIQHMLFKTEPRKV